MTLVPDVTSIQQKSFPTSFWFYERGFCRATQLVQRSWSISEIVTRGHFLSNKISHRLYYEIFNLTWGATSRWSSSQYCSMRNSDEKTIGKVHPTLQSRFQIILVILLVVSVASTEPALSRTSPLFFIDDQLLNSRDIRDSGNWQNQLSKLKTISSKGSID